MNMSAETLKAEQELLLLQKPTRFQPIVKPLGPLANRTPGGGAHSKSVTYAGVDVQFGRSAGFFQSQVKLGETLRDVLPIILSTCQKGRRRLLRELHVPRDSRVEERLERRFGTHAVDRVGRSFGSVVESRRGQRGQF